MFALALCGSLPSWSQEIDFQGSIDASSEALIRLDLKASDCIQALDSSANADALCDDFMAAIDGELMASYIEQCSTLKNWRSEYVEQSVASDLASNNANSKEMLRRLISIEYTCSETSLQNITQFVVVAFNRLRNNAANNGILGADVSSLRQRLSEGRFTTLEDQERQRLQNAVQNQQNRSQQNTQQQFNQLENELIRQQIRRTNPPH